MSKERLCRLDLNLNVSLSRRLDRSRVARLWDSFSLVFGYRLSRLESFLVVGERYELGVRILNVVEQLLQLTDLILEVIDLLRRDLLV